MTALITPDPLFDPRRARLTTAEIIYGMPDRPLILQQFVWQEYDYVPHLPILQRFLRFWDHELDGKVRLVRVACAGLIDPIEFRYCRGEFSLN